MPGNGLKCTRCQIHFKKVVNKQTDANLSAFLVKMLPSSHSNNTIEVVLK